jgi:hypothetical protein
MPPAGPPQVVLEPGIAWVTVDVMSSPAVCQRNTAPTSKVSASSAPSTSPRQRGQALTSMWRLQTVSGMPR